LLEGKFVRALRVELKQGFSNEGVVHELSWIPGVQTGAVLLFICTGKGIDLQQKIAGQANVSLARGPLVTKQARLTTGLFG
jgi:hypothetical protein